MKAVLRHSNTGDVVVAMRMNARQWRLVREALGHQNIVAFADQMHQICTDKVERDKVSDEFLGMLYELKG